MIFKLESFISILFLIFYEGHCDEEDHKLNWWRNTLGYEIYPFSFKDTDGDGIGDLKGIISKLDYLEDLGVELIWTTPITKSAMVDFGYDVTDFTDINPIFGTLEDFDLMMKELNKRGMKYLMDFVPNHTSDKHEWFQKSVDRIDPYTDYYIWKDPKEYTEDGERVEPNNWKNILDLKSAWEWHPKREQYYLHQFNEKQVDLNLRNPKVVEELKEVLRFWIKRGVSGFRLDATKYLIEDKLFRDEHKNASGHLMDSRTQNLPESYEFIHELREMMDKEFTEKDGYTRILVPEAYTDVNNTMSYYDHDGYTVTHYPFNFNLLFKFSYTFPNSVVYNNAIREWINNMPKGSTPNWSSENHDFERSTKFGEEITDIMNAAILLLPGAGFMYYGQEIGMMEPKIRKEDKIDNLVSWFDRNARRSPMQWDDSRNAGFTSGNKTWLPVNVDYWRRNVEKQKREEKSHLNHYKKLSKLRKTKTCRDGDLKTFILSYESYAFSRSYPGEPTYAVVINFGLKIESVNMREIFGDKSISYEVLVGSENSGYSTGFESNTENNDDELVLRPRSCVVLGTITSKPISPSTIDTSKFPIKFNNNNIALGGMLLILFSTIALIFFKIIK